MANYFEKYGESDAPAAPENHFAKYETKDVGRGTAALEGYLSGASANFRDEIYGASKASGLPDAMGGFRAPVGAAKLIWEYLNSNPGEATAIYEKARDEKRGVQKQAKEQYPGTYLAGEVGGGLMLPGGAAAHAATLPARMGRGAAIGAGYGAAAGAGEGENWTDRGIRAGTGGVIGGAIGAAAPPVVEGVIQGGRILTDPIRRAITGSVNADTEASRRLAVAQSRDVQADPGAASRLTPQEFADAQARGQPVMLADMGGELTRRTANSAAITSPEGGQVLKRALDDRFDSQGPRIASWLRQSFHYPNADAQREALEQSARAVNRPAYQRAFSDHDGPMWDDALAGLAQDPVMQSAIRRAAVSVRTERTMEGYRPFNNPFSFEESSGRLTLRRDSNGNTIYPDLQFWDLVKRELDKQNTREAQSFAGSLRGHLDELTRNPETGESAYRVARQGAAGFFGAENALSAGENFVGAGARYGLPETRRALAEMTEQQRQLFQDGYVSRFIERIDAAPDRRNILNVIGRSPAEREELYVALGRERAHELEALLRVEGIMNLTRDAVKGNSWTAQRLYSLGLAGGGAAGGGMVGIGAINQDPKEMTIGAVMAALASGGKYIDQRIARRVAEAVASDSPARLAVGIQQIARNQNWLNALRGFDRRVAASAGQQGAFPVIPTQNGGSNE